MAPLEMSAEFIKYKEDVQSRAENLLRNVIPAKITEMQALLDSKDFCLQTQLPLVKAVVSAEKLVPLLVVKSKQPGSGKYNGSMELSIPAKALDMLIQTPGQSNPLEALTNKVESKVEKDDDGVVTADAEEVEDEDGATQEGQETDEDASAEPPAPKKPRLHLLDVTMSLKNKSPSKPESDRAIVPTNPIVAARMEVVDSFLRELVENARLLESWISLLIPKTEDGNNFGVAVQAEVLAGLGLVIQEAAKHHHKLQDYYSERAEMLDNLAKRSHIEDYRLAVAEWDCEVFSMLRTFLTDAKNAYAFNYDRIVKNWSKVNEPRSSNAQSMF